MTTNRGNALFLILIAVALFAALSYAITQSSRGGGASTDRERDRIIASQLIQVMADLKGAALRLHMRGVSPEAMHFHDNADRTIPCAMTDGTCLFTADGGGARFPVYGQDVPVDAFDPAVYSPTYSINFTEVNEGATASGVPSQALVGIGSPTKPEGAVAFVGIRKSVCEAINKILSGSTSIYVLQASDIDTSTMPAYTTVNFDVAAHGGIVPCIDGSAFAAAPPGTMYVYGDVLLEN